ncbi:MAG: 23S rRNA (guanosine(2251)-2'-O)-methyltransferase RlmB [Prevotellaceae bacterium]|jgi:23S rRNA (guanosine2251-2'-O)-methyltransferase|nr:23S rRNA (guanosine(2251)-2'-O)-methyltransferase RlmB [Prevotellaceae bacterium]
MKEKEMIFGLRPVIEAIEAGKELDRILIKKDLGSDLAKELFGAMRGTQIPLQKVPVEKLNRLTMKNHQGVVAYLSSVEYQHIADIIPTLYEEAKTPFVVVLDGITDVRNFGAIARTCECTGVDAIVVPTRGGAAVNADAVKTSAGALHNIAVCRENVLTDTVRFLKASGLTVFAASEKATKNYTEVDFTVPVAIVMGAEDTGVSPQVLRLCDEMVSIPILGTIQSLNVSVAAGVLMYEVIRQRQ